MLQALTAIDGKTIAHRHADRVGNEDRHTAGALGDELTIRTYQPNGEIFVLVYVRTKGRARDVRVDLIGDRNDAVTDDFEGDGIDGWLRCCELYLCFRLSRCIITVYELQGGEAESGKLEESRSFV